MELRQLMTTLRRRWKFVVAIFLSGVIGAFVLSMAVTPMYESTVRVYLSASDNGAFDQVQMGMYTSLRAKSYAALAEDATVMKRVIERAGVNTTSEALAGQADIEVVPDTVVLLLTVRDADPDVAGQIADAYAQEIAATVNDLENPGGRKSSPVAAKPQGGASVSGEPVSPDVPLNVAVGAILGLLFGVGGAALRELMADKPVEIPAGRRPLPPAREADLFQESVH